MKKQHFLIFFLFFFAGNIFSQNQYDRLKGQFEGNNGTNYLQMIVSRSPLSNGKKALPRFTVYEMKNGNYEYMIYRTMAMDGKSFNPTEEFIIIYRHSTLMERQTAILRFVEGSTPEEDYFEVLRFYDSNKYNYVIDNTVTLRRVK